MLGKQPLIPSATLSYLSGLDLLPQLASQVDCLPKHVAIILACSEPVPFRCAPQKVSFDGICGSRVETKTCSRNPFDAPFQLALSDFLCLPESRSAAAHNLPLANELGTEFGSIEREVDIEVHPVKGSLRGIHALEILLEVLP
jgi:hypothetical protein